MNKEPNDSITKMQRFGVSPPLRRAQGKDTPICIRTCNIQTYVHTLHVHMYESINICVHTYTCTYTRDTHVHTHIQQACKRMYTDTYIHAHAYIHVKSCTCVYMLTYMYSRNGIRTYTCTNTHNLSDHTLQPIIPVIQVRHGGGTVHTGRQGQCQLSCYHTKLL